jgi:PAS domain S-box-containing protein
LSEYFRRGLGLTIKVGDRPEDLFTQDEQVQVWRSFYRRAIDEGPFSADYSLFAGTRVLELSLNVMTLDGTVFGVSVFGKDVTEERRAEGALRESEERFRNLFDLASDAFFITDLADGKILDVNRTACEQLGYSRDELLTMSVHDIDQTDRGIISAGEEALSRERSAILRTTHVRRDGTSIQVELNGRVIDYEGRQAVLSIARDLSERRPDEAVSQGPEPPPGPRRS